MTAVARRPAALPPADVCIIVEGCYPYVPGGVSAWIDWLMRSQPDTSFQVVALWPRPTGQPARYRMPDNVVGLDHLYLQDFGGRPVTRLAVPPGTDALADARRMAHARDTQRQTRAQSFSALLDRIRQTLGRSIPGLVPHHQS